MTLPTCHLSKTGFQLSELTEDRCKGYLKRQGIETYHRMLASMVKTVLIPPDLHAGEILTNNNGWSLIDPKPYIGDPTYDITQHLLNCTERIPHRRSAGAHRPDGITHRPGSGSHPILVIRSPFVCECAYRPICCLLSNNWKRFPVNQHQRCCQQCQLHRHQAMAAPGQQ